jgi:hypothetical protein
LMPFCLYLLFLYPLLLTTEYLVPFLCNDIMTIAIFVFLFCHLSRVMGILLNASITLCITSVVTYPPSTISKSNGLTTAPFHAKKIIPRYHHVSSSVYPVPLIHQRTFKHVDQESDPDTCLEKCLYHISL